MKRGLYMEKEINMSIQLKVKNMYYFLLRHTYTSFSGLFGVFLSIGALVLLATTYQSNDSFRNVLLVLVAVIFLIVNPIQLWLKAAQQVKMNPMFQKPLYYYLSETGILVKQEEQELSIAWEDIVRVIETKKYIILYLSRVHAYIWPVTEMDNQHEQVKEMLKQHLNEKQYKWRKS